MNILLRFITTILTIAIVMLANNRIVLWVLLVLLTFYNLLKSKNKKLLLIDLILVILLGLSTKDDIYLLVFKIIFIIDFLLTTYDRLTSLDENNLINRKNSIKEDYFENSFDRVVKRINDKKETMYDSSVSIDDRIKKDLERSYLQSKIRYYGLSSKNKCYNWNIKDTLVLLIFLIVFVILFILR